MSAEKHEARGTPIEVDALRLWGLLFGSSRGYLVTFTGKQSERPDARQGELDDRQQRYWRYPADRERAAAYLLRQSEVGRDAYFGVHLFRESGSRRKDNAVDRVRALWCDTDGAKLPGSYPEPNLRVESSPGREHQYWLLSEPLSPEEAARLNRRIAYGMGADIGKWGLGTVLRTPGTRNYKREEPTPVVARLVIEEPYDSETLDAALPAAADVLLGHQGQRRDERGPVGEVAERGPAAPVGEPPVELLPADLAAWLGERTVAGETGGIDRSRTLHWIGCGVARGLRRTGVSEAESRRMVEDAVEERDAALGYNKYTGRADRAERYAELAEEAMAEAARAPLQGTAARSRGGARGGGPGGPAVVPTPQSYPLTDTGNAERLVARHGKDIRYCYARKAWYVWDGVRWVRDEGGEVMRRAKETVRSIYAEAAAEPDADMRKSMARHARLSESRRAREAMVALAQPEPGVSVEVGEMDRDLWLMNVSNGTIDLRSGELREHRREDVMTKLSPVAYDPDARSEVLERYMGFATDGKPGLAEFIWRAVGYSLTGDTRQKALFFLHGPKDTGKTTFVEAVRAALGDYADTLDFRALLSYSRGDGAGPRPEIAKLPGTRFVASSEVREGSRLATELVKALTGWDTIEVRTLHEKPFSFAPQCKLWLAANHAPRVPEDDEAAWERIHRIPFDNEPEVKEPEVASHLRDPGRGGPAILAAAVQGCADFQRRGLAPPEAVRRATREYRREQDVLRGFLDEYCVLGDDLWVPTGQLREAYEKWARENGETNLLKGRKWGDRLKAHGCEPARAPGGGTRIWRGIALVGGPEKPDGGEGRVRAAGGMTDSENEEIPANSGQGGESMTGSTPESESFSRDPLAEEGSRENPSQSVIRRESVTSSSGDSRREQHEAVEWDEGWANELMSRAVRYVAQRYVEGENLVDDTAENEEISAAKEAEDPARYREAVRAWVKVQLREFELRRKAETAEAKTAGDALAAFLEGPPGWWIQQAEECIRQGSPARLLKPLAASTASEALGDPLRHDEARPAVEQKLQALGRSA